MRIADFHCDTISELFHHNQEHPENPWSLAENELQIDIAKLQTSNYCLQHFAMFIDMKKYPDSYGTALHMLDYYATQLESFPETLAPVQSMPQLDTAIRQGKIASIATIEEGGILEGDVSRLDTLYEKGIRLLTLTWNYPNCIGAPNNLHYGTPDYPITPNTTTGLTAFGYEVVAKCEDMGIVLDVSHLSDAGFYQLADCTNRPFTASHSSARAICPHVRNASDDMIRTLANRGGVIGVNFHPPFIKTPTPGITTFATVNDTVAHIRHIYQIGGLECICLGSDFDGIDKDLELEDASCMPLLFDALKKDGFHEREIEAIFFQNMLTFYRNYGL